jgi:hypothetical protein
MDESVESPSRAWQPLTPRGVATFADATFARLFLLQGLVAVLASVTVVWFVQNRWLPVVAAAIEQLPAQGEIRSGKLNWGEVPPRILAENRFLAFTVDLTHSGQARSPAHLQFELGRDNYLVFSLFGALDRPYPREWVVAFNRVELKPWWGAWVPPILGLTAAGVIVGLLASWTVLATLYSLFAWVLGVFTERTLSLGGSWRLAGAALMPGALVMITCMLLYGVAAMDLVRLLIANGAPLVVGWVYLVTAVFCRPRRSVGPAAANPFAPAETTTAHQSSDPSRTEPENPFSASQG